MALALICACLARAKKAQRQTKNAKCTHEMGLKTREKCFFEKKLQKNAKVKNFYAIILASEIFGIFEKQPKKAQKNS